MTTPAEASDSPIIVGVDGSADALRAVAWAAAEAALRRRRLHLVTASLTFGAAAGESGTLRQEGERMLSQAVSAAWDTVPAGEFTVTGEIAAEMPAPALIQRSRRAALVVVGSQGIDAFRRGLPGSVGSAVARHGHCPVVVVHDTAGLEPAWAARPVLVGVDGSENSMAAVEFAYEEASRRKTGLVALHAWIDSSASTLPVRDWVRVHAEQDLALAESLAGFGERFPDVPVRRVVVPDRPARALVDHAVAAQLLVVGSHGRGGFSGMLLGSVSTAVLHTVECPTVVVRGPRE